MRLALLKLGILGIFAALMAVSFGASTTEAANTAGTFRGEWRAISPFPGLGDAHLSITGGRHVVGLRLTDPFDMLFCDSGPTAADAVSVRASGVGILTGPKTLSAVFFYRCSDGTVGFQSVDFNFSPVTDDTNAMVDSSGHFWTRLP